MSKKTLFLLVILFSLLAFVGRFVMLDKEVSSFPATAGESSNTDDTSSFAPYEDMTIPYLREREYESQLNEREFLSQNESYTSYLTSYNSDGYRINGLLTVPTGEEPESGWPAIVFVHGYIPPTEYQTTEKYVDYVDYLARSGYVVFKIDLRGHGDSEGEAGGGYFGSDYVVDTLNAYAALQHADFVNEDAIGLWGHSMAGNILMRSMAAKPTIPAAVIWAGAVYTYEDMIAFGINDNSYMPPETSSPRSQRRQELFDRYGSPSAESPFWQRVAPTNYLDDIEGAISIHHAVDDSVVTVAYSRNLVELLNETSIPHKLYEYPTGGHNILEPSFSQAMQRTVDFFNQYLK